MRVVVPFATEMPKTRLGGVLTDAERDAFARAMLGDVLSALDATGHDPELLATGPVESDVAVTVDELPRRAAITMQPTEPVPAVVRRR